MFLSMDNHQNQVWGNKSKQLTFNKSKGGNLPILVQDTQKYRQLMYKKADKEVCKQ